ncbi:head closure Hc1 [Mycobacterium phage Rem711]|uniref:Head-to-tail connector protein n=1 Tax=Mycobacterium phage Rem711 TaxID=2079285 RepID=A0A2K9VET7_9CAUD|nr:head closure Hc1 [Mycobacterium phage Rem711]AUV60793.1 head-to-tail connector protein [Mycobacterium phage Rem711]
MSGFHVGADVVELIFRDPVLDDNDRPVLDAAGRPTFTERVVPKTGAKFTIDTVTESGTLPPVAVYSAKCALQPDADALALTTKDAIRHDGKVFEMSADARVKVTLIDRIPHHVRAFCSREEPVASIAERVTITARGGQDDDGRRLPDGTPVDVLAFAVDAGNTAERYGASGTVEEADYTVVLPADAALRDGDWLTVRGRRCVARIQREFSQHPQRNQVIALAKYRGGG